MFHILAVGTGKTETVKDLGKALGIWVLVNNCSEGLDYKSLETLLSGLAQCGIWGCFDEFNRINIEVLSVVAQRIHLILSALAQKLTKFIFDGQTIDLKATVGLFITMNPGYAGRTELPDNLKSMFRPISMITPDSIIIAENLLFSQGFRKSKLLANKVVTLFNLTKQKLSIQPHYDFGLRSMVSQLRYASEKFRELPNEDEECLILLAMKDMNGAKLTAEDVVLFNDILSDIFPRISTPTVDYADPMRCIADEFHARNLQKTPSGAKKVIELLETKNSRHSVMILGASGSAKSTTWKTLQGVHSRMKSAGKLGWSTVNVHAINPKTLNLGELYGEYNLSTGEWTDGVVSSVMRQVCSDKSDQLHWILFDGPVDAIWIEDMNSVMDDNKVLTLINREHISLSSHVSLLFETEDLAVASPATVSRCGIIYNDYMDLGWKPFVQSWLQQQNNEQCAACYQRLFNDNLDKVLQFKRKNCKEVIQTLEMNQVQSMCHLIQCLTDAKGALTQLNEEDIEDVAKLIFFFSLIWTICACVDEFGRSAIDNYIRELEPIFPTKDTVYDYYIDMKQKLFVSWRSRLTTEQAYNEDTPFYKIVIPTIDTVKYSYLISTFLLSNRGVLVNGPIGSGKTLIAQSVLNDQSTEKYASVVLNMSSHTSVKYIQEAIEACTEKRSKEIMAPPGNKTLICFMDDFNMPVKQKYGAQPTLELIRQWKDYGFWYNRRTQLRTYVKGLAILAAMGPAGGARQIISNRVMGKFYQLNITFPQESVISAIFGSMLANHLNDFSAEIRSLWKPITEATISLYQTVLKKLLPTIDKIHYLFNLRDISRVFQGLLRSDKNHHSVKDDIIRLWVHECYRVFSDRINDHGDYDWFSKRLNDTLGIHMDLTFQNIFPSRSVPIFADFISSKFYEHIKNESQLADAMQGYLTDYNTTPGMRPMNIVLFRDVFEHVTRIVRIVSQPKGHVLMIGIGGSGRRSMAKLAAFILDYSLFQIQISQNYGVYEFREDLKTLYKMTGVSNKRTMFLFSDTQAVDEAFFEILNNMLSVGVVPNLFKPDEWQDIQSNLEQAAIKAGISAANTEAVTSLFYDRAKSNLFMAICVSPNGDEFRNRIRQYPALVNCCTIDWFREWPEAALLEVAKKYLDNCDLSARGEVDATAENYTGKDQIRHLIAKSFAGIHKSVLVASAAMLNELGRYNYVTPTSYIELLSGFQARLAEQRQENSNEANKLRTGLFKIDDARAKVETMSEKLKINQVELDAYQKECERFMDEIKVQTGIVNAQKVKVSEQSEKVAVEEIQCQRQANSAKKDLDKAMPALSEAARALDSLNKKDLTEVKSYAKPPSVVEKVMEAVMILQGRPPTWSEAKKQLGEQNFLDQLRMFDKDHVNEKTLRKISWYTRDPQLEPQKVGVVSLACKSLCIWVRAIENYAIIYKDVGPKIELHKQALQSLEAKQKQLADAQREVNELEAKINEHTQKFNEKLEIKKELEMKSLLLKQQLDRAVILVDSLAGARQRWIDMVAQLDGDFIFLPGNCLLASAFLSYAGPFTSEIRDSLIAQWKQSLAEKNIAISPSFAIASFLCGATTIREWQINGLPSDCFSTENGIIVQRSNRWPLLIDPQGQAHKWIKSLESKNNIVVIDMDVKNITTILEQSIQSGRPILLQNVGEHLDASLNSILNKEIVQADGQMFIKMNDKLLNFNRNFKFYITTKLVNPHFSPEITTKTTLVNFAIKEEGLQNQLLGIVVRQERPDLEEQKDKLVVNIALSKTLLHDLENEILRILNESQISVIENEELFEILQISNRTSSEVTESLAKAEITEVEIDTAREVYRPCALRASILFFILLDLSRIDPMYQFSLAAYTEHFIQSISKCARSANVQRRIAMLNEYHTYSFYSSTCRGLFEQHKLLFSFHMCMHLLQAEGNFVEAEYNFLIIGGIVLDRSKQIENPAPQWIADEFWDNITELDKVSGFHGLAEDLVNELKDWYAWYASPEPETQPLIGKWENVCNQFQKMLIIRCFRRDRILFCIRSFIVAQMGRKFVEPPVLNIRDAFDESTAKVPIFFILSSGADPASSLIQLSEDLAMRDKFKMISLGQGQAERASKLIADGVQSGHWVFLANCNLSMSWMPDLDKIIENIQSQKVATSFRLWMSSSPNQNFPASILQYCIKITTGMPQGIRTNLKRLYDPVTEEKFSKCHDRTYRKLFFALCFFHAIILERKQFQQLGWNISYSFNDADFQICDSLLLLYLDEYRKETPWRALKYLISDVMYGGHVTDPYDRRLLVTYINQYFSDAILRQRNPLLSTLKEYYLPEDSNIDSCKEYIALLPSFDAPEAFGCDLNAATSSQISHADLFFGTILQLAEKQSSSSSQNNDRKLKDLVMDLSSKMPKQINFEELAALMGPKKSPYNIVLLQEAMRYNNLLSSIVRSLNNLLRAVDGFEVMSFELETIANALINGRVPIPWLTVYASLKPLGAWIRDLIARLDYFTAWANTLHLPTFFWLGAFTFPTSFLTAALQTYSRIQTVSIDQLTWNFVVLPDDLHYKEYLDRGILVNGLFLEGAGWNAREQCLQDSVPMELIKRLPSIAFEPIRFAKRKINRIYSCPAYYIPERAVSFITEIDLNSGGKRPDVWIKRGTAILLNLAN